MSRSVRYRDKAQWEAKNPFLPANDIGVEEDTGKMKRGDGVKRWNSLSYITTPSYVVPEEISDSSGAYTRVTVDGTYVPEFEVDSAEPAALSCRIYKAAGTTQKWGHGDYGYIQMDTVEYNDDPSLFVPVQANDYGLNFGPTMVLSVTRPGLYLAHWTTTYEGGGAGLRSSALASHLNPGDDGRTHYDSGGPVIEGGYLVAGSAAPVRLVSGQRVSVVGYTEVGEGSSNLTQVNNVQAFATGLSLTRLGA